MIKLVLMAILLVLFVFFCPGNPVNGQNYPVWSALTCAEGVLITNTNVGRFEITYQVSQRPEESRSYRIYPGFTSFVKFNSWEALNTTISVDGNVVIAVSFQPNPYPCLFGNIHKVLVTDLRTQVPAQVIQPVYYQGYPTPTLQPMTLEYGASCNGGFSGQLGLTAGPSPYLMGATGYLSGLPADTGVVLDIDEYIHGKVDIMLPCKNWPHIETVPGENGAQYAISHRFSVVIGNEVPIRGAIMAGRTQQLLLFSYNQNRFDEQFTRSIILQS